MTNVDTIAQFDENAPGQPGKLFGLPFSVEQANVVIVPIPWEVTVSYRAGTARAPEAVLNASAQVDLFSKELPDAWKMGIAMLPVSQDLYEENVKLREHAARHIAMIEQGAEAPVPEKVNAACESLQVYVKNTTLKYMREGKLVGLLGGDHSTPLGFLQALNEQHEAFGILQIDAHADLRKGYEGFTYSHASIMHHALKIQAVSRLVQVGIRDLCDEEFQAIQRSQGRIKTFFDEDLKSALYRGATWDALCRNIVAELPEKVYISFDADGLDPKLCPNTGTPVAGGLEFAQALHLFRTLVQAGKKIIGFDLNEVGYAEDNDWDANVAARLLYQLCLWMGASQGRTA
jgi:agmatinase